VDEGVLTGNTAWLLTSSALVMLMLPGLALFYGGMVRSKNVLSTLMHSFFALGVVGTLWVLVGYSLAFSSDAFGGMVGDLASAGFAGVGQVPAEDTAYPPLAFAVFQMMFAIITPALITGAFAERIKFTGYVAFISLWLLLVYSPIAHWVWQAEGWLFELGALDFAGGTVVHINSGAAALAVALVIGKRRSTGKPHNLTLTVLGAGLLWFGWFGFNAGSALAANGLAANAFVVTQVAAGTGAIGWVLVDFIKHKKGTTLGAASGAVAGLVAITPCAGYVTPMASIAVGLIAGMVCAYAVGLKARLGYDDALDVVGVHMFGGIAGALLVGLFATASVNPDAVTDPGLLVGGGAALLGRQIVAVLASLAYSFVVSLVIAKVVDLVVGLRVSPEEEQVGLDVSQHAEEGYVFTEDGAPTLPAPQPAPAPAPASAAAAKSTAAQGGEA